VVSEATGGDWRRAEFHPRPRVLPEIRGRSTATVSVIGRAKGKVSRSAAMRAKDLSELAYLRFTAR